jgi:2-polyprenyl-6-methoxyphenol hydroxylase-like FAD-dependent oxidoreductase
VGANTALRDAVLLCARLIDAAEGRLGVVEAVGRYEQKMITYGFDAALKSREQMTDEDIHKPVIGRVVLALMRTVLRIANDLSPLKNRVARSMLDYRGAGRDDADFRLPSRSSETVAS